MKRILKFIFNFLDCTGPEIFGNDFMIFDLFRRILKGDDPKSYSRVFVVVLFLSLLMFGFFCIIGIIFER